MLLTSKDLAILTLGFSGARMPPTALHPFHFVAQRPVTSPTGISASNLKDFVAVLESVPESVVYHHTHFFLRKNDRLTPKPSSEFAWWVYHQLEERSLGEQLLAIDMIRFNSLIHLRDQIAHTIRHHLGKHPVGNNVAPVKAFWFHSTESFFLPTRHVVYDLADFLHALNAVSTGSLYYHVFEARIRLGSPTNDFSRWLADELGERDLAAAIARLNPYTQTLEEIRSKIASLVSHRMVYSDFEAAI